MNDHPSIQEIPYERWRHIKEGGDIFVETYLEAREAESSATFNSRRNMTPDPATASAAVDDVINSFAARMDVSRTGGSKEYQECILGKLGGVDKEDTDLQTYLLKETIPELCYMSKFGWLIQNFTQPGDPRKFPYIIPLRAEQIRNWTYVNRELVSLLISDTAAVVDPETGFSDEDKEVFRVFRKLENGTIETKVLDENDVEIDLTTLLPGSSAEILNIDEIPAVIFELPSPLLKKIDRMQIAVLNMESADIEWLRTANITLYVEQQLGFGNLSNLTKSDNPTEEEDQVEIVLGSTRGRTYGHDMERPAFIAPPAEPIRVSMEKQKEIALKAKDILKSNISDMKLPSAESLAMLGQGMEAGLYIIGTILMLGEIKFARLFHKFQGKDNNTNISYPKKYELRTESDRLSKADELKKIQQKVGSNVAKKYLEIQILDTLLAGKMPYDDYSKAVKEILDSDFSIYDPETVISLVESGILSKQLASTTLGAPEGDAAVATEEHIKRIQAVKISQTSGLSDVNPDPTFTEDVKKEDAVNDVRDNGGS